MISTGTLTVAGWIGGWDAHDVPNGKYILQSVATDTLGQSTTSDGVRVTVDNDPLSTRILIPSRGAMLNGSAILDAIATGTADILGIQIAVSRGPGSDNGQRDRAHGDSSPGEVLQTLTTALTVDGWIALWDLTGVADGTYTLRPVATEVGGTMATGHALKVTVGSCPTDGHSSSTAHADRHRPGRCVQPAG
jgi:hypothetical protein